jgi:hypothetical protein
MPIRDYPFIEIAGSGIFVLRSEKSTPRLWIRVINPNNHLTTYTTAIVDTGAHDCLFPADWAANRGYDIQSSTAEEIETANGITQAYPHLTDVTILDVLADGQPDKGGILIPLGDIQVRYVKGLREFLLGRATFLDRFILSINYPERKFSIRLPEYPGYSEYPEYDP